MNRAINKHLSIGQYWDFYYYECMCSNLCLLFKLLQYTMPILLIIYMIMLPQTIFANNTTNRQHIINLSSDGSFKQFSINANTNDGTISEYHNYSEIKYDSSKHALIINFENLQDKFVDDNNYLQNNSSMWNQEVFEIFIALGQNDPTQYLEFEINPNNATFTGWITNKNGKGTDTSIEFFDAKKYGIITTITKSTDSWRGHIELPLSIFNLQKTSSFNNHHFRVNFFRVAAKNFHKNIDQNKWACDTKTCAYLAWSPTHSGINPAFHITKYFGTLNIQ